MCSGAKRPECLRAFPLETAPGPTGLRVQHLRDACVVGNSDSFLAQLAEVVSLLAQGRAPSFVAPVLAGAGLVALPKPQGGVRPIAVGEILRRLTGKCLMTQVREDAQAFFWPAQVGVAVKGGAERAVHAVRAWTQQHAGASQKVLLKLDFRNAFNCVSRDAVLQECAANFPALARWATWCYRQPTRLQFGDHVLHSSTGVQQGDPLGPLLFSVALQPLARALRNGSLTTVSWRVTWLPWALRCMRPISMTSPVGWTKLAGQLAQASPAEKAALRSEAGIGARAFLAAPPSGRTRMEPASFAAELRLRLGVPDAAEDCWCPRCDAVLDRFGRGERTQRHNAIRDLFCTWLEKAGLHPEKERPGLLLPQSPDDTHSNRRRPADIYVPALAGSPAALDFAVTAPQRRETLAAAGLQTGAAAAAYARHKEQHLNTARVRLTEWFLCRWSWSRLVPGTVGPPLSSSMWLAQWQLEEARNPNISTPPCSRNSAWWRAVTAPGPP